MYRNPMFHDHSKHIDVDFHNFRDKVAQRNLVVQCVPSRLKLVVVFLKRAYTLINFAFYVTISP